MFSDFSRKNNLGWALNIQRWEKFTVWGSLQSHSFFCNLTIYIKNYWVQCCHTLRRNSKWRMNLFLKQVDKSLETLFRLKLFNNSLSLGFNTDCTTSGLDLFLRIGAGFSWWFFWLAFIWRLISFVLFALCCGWLGNFFIFFADWHIDKF